MSPLSTVDFRNVRGCDWSKVSASDQDFPAPASNGSSFGRSCMINRVCSCLSSMTKLTDFDQGLCSQADNTCCLLHSSSPPRLSQRQGRHHLGRTPLALLTVAFWPFTPSRIVARKGLHHPRKREEKMVDRLYPLWNSREAEVRELLEATRARARASPLCGNQASRWLTVRLRGIGTQSIEPS